MFLHLKALKISFARPLLSVRHRFISVEDVSPSLLYSLQDEELDTEFRLTSRWTAVRERTVMQLKHERLRAAICPRILWCILK